MKKNIISELDTIMMRMRMYENKKKARIKKLKQFLINDILFNNNNADTNNIKNIVNNGRKLNLNENNNHQLNSDIKTMINDKIKKSYLVNKLNNDNTEIHNIQKLINKNKKYGLNNILGKINI